MASAASRLVALFAARAQIGTNKSLQSGCSAQLVADSIRSILLHGLLDALVDELL